MENQPTKLSAWEESLRQRAPALRAPDRGRVEKACARAADAQPLSPLREPHTFIRPLLRLAACLALMAGIALLMRPKAPAPAPASQPLPSFATLADIQDLVAAQPLKNALACEAEDLAEDLAGLTAVLNDRTFDILF